MKIRNRKAFTLMEIMITTVLFSFVMGGVYTTYLVGTRSWAYYNDSVILKQEARRLLFTMAQELREARNIFITIEPGRGVTIHFYRPSLGDVSYSWANQGERAYQIIRKNKKEEKILARYISEFSLTQETMDDVTIEIHVIKSQKNAKEMNFHLKEKIALRTRTGLLRISEDDEL